GDPDSLIGYFKSNIMPNDSARVYIYSENGTVYGDKYFTSSMNSENYVRFAMPMHVEGTDTIQLVFNSTTKNWSEAIPGSWIQFDSLYLKGAGLNPGDTLGNNDFERWTPPQSYSFENPADWNTNNQMTELMADTSYVQKSDDAHSGSYSITLISDTVPGQPTGEGPINLLHNGDIAGDAPAGGLITNQWPDSIVAYCKYAPVGNDLAFLGVVNGNVDLSKENPTPQNSSIKQLSTTPSFEKFVFDMTSITTDPSDQDSVLIIISSSNIIAESYEIGSQLWIDDIALYPQIVNTIHVTSANGETEIYVDSALQMHAEVFPDYALNDSVAWSVDQESIATINSNGMLTGTSPGTVTVTATSTDGTLVEDTKDITVLATNSSTIYFDVNDVEISIYPVPAKSVINIASEKTMSGIIKLMDVSGKTLIKTMIDKNKKKTIDVSELQTGVYFIQLEINEKLINKKLIIKRP
ncbi:MAG: T9SS type A sorting domain-containing protein, partial [Bacteroidota bacterium]